MLNRPRAFQVNILLLAICAAASPALSASLSTATLQWTAPGDDGTSGTAKRYDIRRSTSPITLSNFVLADTVGSPPAPALAGTSQTCAVVLPTAGVTYYFGIRTVDDVGNWSGLSNIITVTSARTATRKGPPTEAAFSPPWPNPAQDHATFLLEAPTAAYSAVEAFDAMGRHVRRVFDGELVPGVHDIQWNLRDDRGERVAGGVYFVRVRIGNWTKTRRLVVVS